MAALLILVPVANYSLYSQYLLPLLFSFTLLAAVYAVAENKFAMAVAVTLATPAMIIFWMFGPDQHTALSMISSALNIAVNVIVVSLVLVEIFKATRVDVEILSGAMAVYLLIAVNFAFLFHLMEGLEPGSFDVSDRQNFDSFLYFSLVTFTTLGYGDITPVTKLARIWAALESVIGVLYATVLIARLVSMYRR
jgi:hypothetical protein